MPPRRVTVEELEEELVEAELPELLSPPVLKRLLQALHFLAIFIGILGIILISISLNHDSRWNAWVDGRFNLNHKNSQFRPHMDEYVDVQSQQHWISLLARDLSFEQFYLLLTIAAVAITAFHIIGDIRDIRTAPMMGAMVFCICCAFLIVAAILLIVSLRSVDDMEGQVAAMIANVKINNNMTGGLEGGRESLLAASHDISFDLQSSISCRIQDNLHNPEVEHHCQLYGIKVVAIVSAFFNAGVYVALIGIFLLKGVCGLGGGRRSAPPQIRPNRTPRQRTPRNSTASRRSVSQVAPLPLPQRYSVESRDSNLPKKSPTKHKVTPHKERFHPKPDASHPHHHHRTGQPQPSRQLPESYPPEDVDIQHAPSQWVRHFGSLPPVDAAQLEEEFRQSIAIREASKNGLEKQLLISRQDSGTGYQPHIQGSSWHIVN